MDFKRWVTQDLLPSIRKTGSYLSDGMTAIGSYELNGCTVRYVMILGIKWHYHGDLKRAGGVKNPTGKFLKEKPWAMKLQISGMYPTWVVNPAGFNIICARTLGLSNQLSLFSN